jgi:hypothetical protein
LTGLNESKLEKRMRFLFETTKWIWKKPTKTTWAYMQPHAGQVTICLPPDKDDDYLLRYIFHELIHFALPGELQALGAFEEDIIIRTLEPRLIKHVTDHRTIHKWWIKRLRELREAK